MNIEIYAWLKIFHLFSMVAWMVGLFYLPRIFVYHAENRYSTDNNVVFKTMEYKLLHYIMIPAMFSTWVFGISLYFITGFYEVNEVWFLIKILAVVLLSMFVVAVVVFCKNKDHIDTLDSTNNEVLSITHTTLRGDRVLTVITGGT